MFVEAGTAAKGKLQGAPTEWIEREVGELGAHIAAATCRWLGLIAELDRRGAHEAWGFHSCGAWLAWCCGVDPRSAREHVRVARALEGLPLVQEEFSCGRLSFSKVRAITRVATPEIEAELVEMASYATAAQLDRLVRGYRRAVSLESAEAAHRDCFLSCEWEEDGSLRSGAGSRPRTGRLFLKAVEHGREAIREREKAHAVCQGGSAEPQPARVHDADALMEVAEHSLAGGTAPRPAGERHQVVVHAEATALAGGAEESGCAIADGPAICAESARRLACDALLVSAGRKSRVVPGAMRRALGERDEGRCRFPGCENRHGSTPTTSSTGRGAGKRSSTTWSCSARAITGSCTRAGSGLRGRPAGSWCFAGQMGSRSPRSPPPLADRGGAAGSQSRGEAGNRARLAGLAGARGAL